MFGGEKCGHESEDESGENGDAQTPSEHHRLQTHTSKIAQLRGRERNDQPKAAPREQKADCAPGECEQHTLRKHLSDEPSALPWVPDADGSSDRCLRRVCCSHSPGAQSAFCSRGAAF